MKTKTYQLAVALVTATAIAFFAFSTQQSAERVIVRSQEMITGLWQSSIVVIDENGQIQELPIDNVKPKNIAENTKKLQRVLNSVSARGFELESSNCGGGDAMVITTFIFKR